MFEAIAVGLFFWILFMDGRVRRAEQAIEQVKNQLKHSNLSVEKNDLTKSPSKPVERQDKPKYNNNIWQNAAVVSEKIVNTHSATKPFDIGRIFDAVSARFSVWLGAIALALAGFYLVQFSIQEGYLSPSVRVVMGILFGSSLLVLATWARGLPWYNDNERIGQALSAAGICVLYASFYAAGELYTLIPQIFTFTAMAGVTGVCLFLSLRHGIFIAGLGLIGGFLTPLLLSSDNPNALPLFLFLGVLVAGVMVLARQKGWWWLGLLAVLFAYGWVVIWFFNSTHFHNDSTILNLFIIGISLASVLSKQPDRLSNKAMSLLRLPISTIMHYVALIFGLILLAVITSASDYSWVDWGFYACLTLGILAMAFFNHNTYGVLVYPSVVVNAILLVTWTTNDTVSLGIAITLFGFLYAIAGFMLQSRSEKPFFWSTLTCTASVGYTLLAYAALDTPHHWPWVIIGLLLSSIGVYILYFLQRTIPAVHADKKAILTVYLATATAFMSFALAMALPGEYLSLAIAVQLLVLAFINYKFPLPNIAFILSALAALFLLLLLPQFILLLQLTLYSLFEAELTLQESVPLVERPFIQLGIPTACLILASYYGRQRFTGKIIYSLEIVSIALFGIMMYYLIRHAMNVDADILFLKASFLERGIITNALLLYGSVCLVIGRWYQRLIFTLSGFVLAGSAVFRITYFDIALDNPLFSDIIILGVPVFNSLLLVYGLPVLLLLHIAREAIKQEYDAIAPYIYVYVLALVFILLNLQLKFLFDGKQLTTAFSTNLELYSFSILWLGIGLVLLFWGMVKNIILLRSAALPILLLTIAKVFLVDVSDLEGLWRVASFLGLGLSLIFISWLYSRYLKNFSQKMCTAK